MKLHFALFCITAVVWLELMFVVAPYGCPRLIDPPHGGFICADANKKPLNDSAADSYELRVCVPNCRTGFVSNHKDSVLFCASTNRQWTVAPENLPLGEISCLHTTNLLFHNNETRLQERIQDFIAGNPRNELNNTLGVLWNSSDIKDPIMLFGKGTDNLDTFKIHETSTAHPTHETTTTSAPTINGLDDLDYFEITHKTPIDSNRPKHKDNRTYYTMNENSRKASTVASFLENDTERKVVGGNSKQQPLETDREQQWEDFSPPAPKVPLIEKLSSTAISASSPSSTSSSSTPPYWITAPPPTLPTSPISAIPVSSTTPFEEPPTAKLLPSPSPTNFDANQNEPPALGVDKEWDQLAIPQLLYGSHMYPINRSNRSLNQPLSLSKNQPSPKNASSKRIYSGSNYKEKQKAAISQIKKKNSNKKMTVSLPKRIQKNIPQHRTYTKNKSKNHKTLKISTQPKKPSPNVNVLFSIEKVSLLNKPQREKVLRHLKSEKTISTFNVCKELPILCKKRLMARQKRRNGMPKTVKADREKKYLWTFPSN